MELTWLFHAHFSDGSFVDQTPEDVSVTGEGSAFTDVINKEGLTRFALVSVANPDENHIFVDLDSGLFRINNLWCALHDQFFVPTEHKLELVYFRETRAEAILNNGEIESTNHYINRYFVGWKTQVNGKELQVALSVGS